MKTYMSLTLVFNTYFYYYFVGEDNQHICGYIFFKVLKVCEKKYYKNDYL